MGKKNRQPNIQLSFKPRLTPEEMKPFFKGIGAENEPAPLTDDEILKGLAGLWHGLGSKGYLSPETAMFIVKSKNMAEDSKLLILKQEYMKMKNQELAEKLNMAGQPDPENEYKPEQQIINPDNDSKEK